MSSLLDLLSDGLKYDLCLAKIEAIAGQAHWKTRAEIMSVSEHTLLSVNESIDVVIRAHEGHPASVQLLRESMRSK